MVTAQLLTVGLQDRQWWWGGMVQARVGQADGGA